MAFESIFQQEQLLFQAGNTGPEAFPHVATDALKRQKALAIYQRMSSSPGRGKQASGKPSAGSLSQRRLEVFDAIMEGEVSEPFHIETPEAAKALLVLAHFDRPLNRMVMEQQALSKADVRSAYRRILKHYHPDQTHVAMTGEIIKKVQDAYSLLRPNL